MHRHTCISKHSTFWAMGSFFFFFPEITNHSMVQQWDSLLEIRTCALNIRALQFSQIASKYWDFLWGSGLVLLPILRGSQAGRTLSRPSGARPASAAAGAAPAESSELGPGDPGAPGTSRAVRGGGRLEPAEVISCASPRAARGAAPALGL